MNHRNLSYSVTPSNNTIQSPRLDDEAQRLKTRLTFSSAKPSAPKRPLINHNFGNASSPQNGYYRSRIGAYHMSRQNPDFLDQLYIPSPDNQGNQGQSVGISNRETTYTSPVNYRSMESGGDTSYMPGRVDGYHSPVVTPGPRMGTPSVGNSQLSYLRQVLNMRRAQSCSPSSLVQLATKRGGGRTGRLLRNGVGSGVATVRLAGVKDTPQPQQETMECSDQTAPNPCDKEVVLSALRQKRKRWTSSAPEENGLQSPITSSPPSAKRSRKEIPAPSEAPKASITIATADRKRSNTTPNTVPAVKRSKVNRSGPSNVLSLSELECEEEESDNEQSRTSRSGTPSSIANGYSNECNSRGHTPPILLDEAEIDRKRDESLGTLKAVFPSSLEAEKKDSLRRKLPIFCATGSKPHLPSPLSSTHSVTQEDLNRDRQATVARLKAFLEADDDATDETDGNMNGNPVSIGVGVVSITPTASVALIVTSASLQTTPSVVPAVSKSLATKTVSFAPIPAVSKQPPSLTNVSPLVTAVSSLTNVSPQVTAVTSVTPLTKVSPLVTAVTSSSPLVTAVTSASTKSTAAVSLQGPLQFPKPSAGGIVTLSQTTPTTAGGVTAATSKPSLSGNQPNTGGLRLANPTTHPLATVLTQPVVGQVRIGGPVPQPSVPTSNAAQNTASLAKGQFTFQLNPQPVSAAPTLAGNSLSKGNGSGMALTQPPGFSLTSHPGTKPVSQQSVQFSSTLQRTQLSTSNQTNANSAQPVQPSTTQPSLFNANSSQPSLFNANPQPSSQPSLFNAKPNTTLFNANVQPSTTQPSAFNAAQLSSQPSLFNANPQPNTTQPSLFNAQPNSQPSLFNANQQPNTAQLSLFNKQPSTTQSSLFNAQPSSQPSLFNAQPSSQPSLFNAQPSSQPSLFNAQPSSQPSLFNAQPSSQPSLFNAKLPSTQPSLFNAKQPSTQPSLFNPSTQPSLFNPSTQPSLFNDKQPSTQPSLFNANQQSSIFSTKITKPPPSTSQPSIFNFNANAANGSQGAGKSQGPQQFKFGAGSTGSTASAAPQPSMTGKTSQPGSNIFKPSSSMSFSMNLASGQTNPLTNNAGGGAVLGGQKQITPFQFGATGGTVPSNAGNNAGGEAVLGGQKKITPFQFGATGGTVPSNAGAGAGAGVFTFGKTQQQPQTTNMFGGGGGNVFQNSATASPSPARRVARGRRKKK